MALASFRVYISHSVGPHELGAVYGMAELSARQAMQPIVPDRRWDYHALPARISELLRGLDAFVAVATLSGQHSEWVNAELAEALRMGLNQQRIISVVDQGIPHPDAGRVVIIRRDNFQQTVEETAAMLQQVQLEQTQRNLLVGLVLGGLLALLLATRQRIMRTSYLTPPSQLYDTPEEAQAFEEGRRSALLVQMTDDFDVRDGDWGSVFAYLQQHPQALSVLLEAPEAIREAFGNVRPILDIVIEPAEGWEELFVVVPSREDDSARSLQRLRRLDEEWFGEAARRADFSINVTTEQDV